MFLWLLGIGPFVVWPVVSIPLEIANANNLLYRVKVSFRHLLHHVKIEKGCLLIFNCFGVCCSYVRGEGGYS